MILIARGKYVSDKILIILVNIRTLTMIFFARMMLLTLETARIILKVFKIF